MRDERIEAILRSQPPDEPRYRGELILERTGPVIVPSPVRSRWPFATALTSLLFVSIVAGLIVTVVRPQVAAPSGRPSASIPPSGSPSGSAPLTVIPWINATPPPLPTPEPSDNARSYPSCRSSDLQLTVAGWSGATGSAAAFANVVNLSANPCTVAGKPGVNLLDSRGTDIATGSKPDLSPTSPLVFLPPGGVADLIVAWGNWCGAMPSRPLSVRLSMPAGDILKAPVRERDPGAPGATPRCDSPGSGSGIGAPVDFRAPEPSSGGYQPATCAPDALSAFLGEWGAAAGTSYANLVALNLGGLDCLFDTTASLELRDADGHLVVVARSEPPASDPSLLLPAGWAAIGTIGYANWCTPPPKLPLRADLVIGSRRRAVVPRSPILVPFCMSAPATPPPDLFFEKPFSIPGTPTPPEADAVDSMPIAITLSSLPTTRPGELLEYTVTLTNISAYGKPLNLAALCPTYTESLYVAGATAPVQTHLALNCGPVVLEPNVPVVFGMRLPIQADAGQGTATLVWQLGARGPTAKGSFEISQ